MCSVLTKQKSCVKVTNQVLKSPLDKKWLLKIIENSVKLLKIQSSYWTFSQVIENYYNRKVKVDLIYDKLCSEHKIDISFS
jgi:hypothetical protein